MTPPLALGQAVHEVIDSLSTLPVRERFLISLSKRFDVSWEKVSGKMGGFKTIEEESSYKERGLKMIRKIEENPGPLQKKAIKIKADRGLPYFWLNDADNIILCGKIDWFVYNEDSDSVHILDFKTGKNEEDEESLQLPIYFLLSKNLQNREVDGASYWYLENDNEPKDMKLPDYDESFSKICDIGRRMKLARQLEVFKCPYGGCNNCVPLEKVYRGEGTKIGISEYSQDIYIL
jgi:ATP-dependent helicase/DNAse subunit B